MSKRTTVALLRAAVLLWLAAPAFPRSYGGGNGSITVEVKDPEKAYAAAAAAAGRHGAVVTSYNSSRHAETGRAAVSAQFQLNKEKAGAFMAELAALGEVKNQSFYERPAVDEEQAAALRGQLEALDKELAALGALAGRAPLAISLVAQHRQGVAGQIQSASAAGGADKVSISLSIQEPGMGQPAGGERRGRPTPPMLVFFQLLTAALAGSLGFLVGRARPAPPRVP